MNIEILNQCFDKIANDNKNSEIIATISSVESNEVVWERSTIPNENVSSLIYPIYSISKTFIAAMILRLIHQNRLRFNTKIAEIFKDNSNSEIKGLLPDWLKQITVQNILTHRSGLADYGGSKIYIESLKSHPQNAISHIELFKSVLEKGQLFEQGEQFEYSNVGYFLLKEIISEITQKHFADAIKKELFDKLNLKRTSIAISLNDLKKCKIPLKSTEFTETEIDIRGVYHPNWVMHGLVMSSAKDLNRFMQAYVTGELYDYDETFINAVNEFHYVGFSFEDCKKPSYGLGLMCDTEAPTGVLIGHNGGGPGICTATYFAEIQNSGVLNFSYQKNEFYRNSSLLVNEPIDRSHNMTISVAVTNHNSDLPYKIVLNLLQNMQE